MKHIIVRYDENKARNALSAIPFNLLPANFGHVWIQVANNTMADFAFKRLTELSEESMVTQFHADNYVRIETVDITNEWSVLEALAVSSCRIVRSDEDYFIVGSQDQLERFLSFASDAIVTECIIEEFRFDERPVRVSNANELRDLLLERLKDYDLYLDRTIEVINSLAMRIESAEWYLLIFFTDVGIKVSNTDRIFANDDIQELEKYIADWLASIDNIGCEEDEDECEDEEEAEEVCNTAYAHGLNTAIIDRLRKHGPGWIQRPIDRYGRFFIPVEETEHEIVVRIQEIEQALKLRKSQETVVYEGEDGPRVYKKDRQNLINAIANWIVEAIEAEEDE